MLKSVVYPLLGLGLLEQLSTATPVLPNVETKYYDPVFPRHDLKARDDAKPWPPSLIDFPFPANKSDVESTDATADNYPPGADKEKDDEELHARSEISKSFIDKSCTGGSGGQKEKILDAWDKARNLVDAQTNIRDGYNYNIPHTQWLGPDWNSESSWIPWRKDFRERNKQNWSRLKTVFSKNAPAHDYIYFYCTDPKKTCKKDENGETIAYQYSSHGWFWSNHYVNFCPGWFDLPTLDAQIDAVKYRPSEQRVMENFEMTRDGALFHEMWHMEKLISVPRTLDYAYQAQNVWNLAKDPKKGTWWSTENADSYHLDAVAIRVQQHFSNSMSPVPREELKNLDAEAYANTSAPTPNNYKTEVLPDEGGGIFPLLGLANQFPDMNVFDEITYDTWPETPKPDPDPPAPTKVLGILTDFMTTLNGLDDLQDFSKLHWLYFQTDANKPVDCRSDTVFDETIEIDRTVQKTYYPEGTKKMRLFDQDCEYTSNNDPGVLKCGDQTIQCKDDPHDKNPSDPNADKGNYPCGKWTRQPVFVCEW